MEAGTNPDAAAAPAAAVASEGSGEPRAESEDEALLSRAQLLISTISSTQANPNPRHLHALASILETQESRSFSSSLLSIYVLLFNWLRVGVKNGRVWFLLGGLCTGILLKLQILNCYIHWWLVFTYLFIYVIALTFRYFQFQIQGIEFNLRVEVLWSWENLLFFFFPAYMMDSCSWVNNPYQFTFDKSRTF